MTTITIHGWTDLNDDRAQTTVTLILERPCPHCQGAGTLSVTEGSCPICAGRGGIPTREGADLLAFLHRHQTAELPTLFPPA